MIVYVWLLNRDGWISGVFFNRRMKNKGLKRD